MTKAEAHRLLDSACRGENVSELDILCALRATGDLAPMQLFERRGSESTGLPSQVPPADPPIDWEPQQSEPVHQQTRLERNLEILAGEYVLSGRPKTGAHSTQGAEA